MDLLALADALEDTARRLRAAHAADTGTAELPFDADGWREWAGGDEAPEDARGRVVDVVLRDGYEMGGPSGALIWRNADHPRDIVRYRIAAEQPES